MPKPASGTFAALYDEGVRLCSLGDGASINLDKMGTQQVRNDLFDEG